MRVENLVRRAADLGTQEIARHEPQFPSKWMRHENAARYLLTLAQRLSHDRAAFFKWSSGPALDIS
jgi:hypothetical protein